ncbi:MAG: methyltransferase domain-containing protein [archaeon]
MAQTTLYTQYPTLFMTDVVKGLGFDSYFDIACGTGGFSIALALMGKKVLGLDKSEKALKIAEFKRDNLHSSKQKLVKRIDDLAERLDPENKQFFTTRVGKRIRKAREQYGDDYVDMCYPKIAGDYVEHETYLHGKCQAKPDVRFVQGDALTDLWNLAEYYDCMITQYLFTHLKPEQHYIFFANLYNLVTEGKGLILTMYEKNHSEPTEDFWDVMEDLGFEQHPASAEFSVRVNEYAQPLSMDGSLPTDLETFTYSDEDRMNILFRRQINGMYCAPDFCNQSFIGTRVGYPSKKEAEKLMKKFCKI